MTLGVDERRTEEGEKMYCDGITLLDLMRHMKCLLKRFNGFTRALNKKKDEGPSPDD